MVQRGRKSVANLAVVPAAPAAPPKAPAELTPEEAQLWTAIVRSRGEFPPPSDTLLAAYVSHAVTARALAKRTREVDVNDVRLLNKLLAMHARETAAMSRLASKLKLLPPRQRSPQVLPKPWDLV
jgi:hypothetical protein